MNLNQYLLIPFLVSMASIIYVLLAILGICYFLRKIIRSKRTKGFLLKVVNFLITKLYTNSSVVRIRKAIYTASLWIGAIDEATKNTWKNSQNTSFLASLATRLKCVYWQMRKLIYKIAMKLNFALLLPFTVRKRLTAVTTETTIEYPINDTKYFL